MTNNKSKHFLKVVEIPLHFHSFEPEEESGLPCAFNDEQYKLRLVRYAEHLKHLLDNPPIHEAACSVVKTSHERIDNYLWAVGELINGLYELSHQSKKTNL